MSNLRPFQIFALAIFGFLAILSVVLLSTFSPGVKKEAFTYGEQVRIWGTLDLAAFRTTFLEIGKTDKEFERVSYEQIDAREFDNVLVRAIAEGRGPDMIVLPSSELVRQRNRILALSYDMLPKRDFRDRYVDGAEIFARPDGVYAIPVFVDPLMLYWNRDIFASGGLAEAPTTWEYVVNYVVPNLTLKDNKRNILQATLPFGEVENVRNAKEIILTLAMQSGSKLVEEVDGSYRVELNRSTTQTGLPPFEAAIQFYINFSNPNSKLYSWNRSQPLDRNAFTAGDLALYAGFGSELKSLQEQNPNLNFDMTQMPQGASATVRRTFGEFYGLAILKSSSNPQGAYQAANRIASPQVSASLSERLGLAPVSRSVLAAGSADPFRNNLLGAALTSRGWLDPDADKTLSIFSTLIEDVTSGRETLNASIKDTEQRIKLVF